MLRLRCDDPKKIASADFGSNMTYKKDGIFLFRLNIHKLPLNKILAKRSRSSSVTL